MSELYELNNGKVSLHLHAGQTKAWDSQKRFTFIFAGTQGGKTSFLPWWLWRETQYEEGDFLAVTATYDLFKLKFEPALRDVFEMFGWVYSASERTLTRKRKPRIFDRIIMRSASSEGGLESATAKRAILDECGQDEFSLTSWEAVLRRLSLAQGRVLGGTTLYNLGWTKREVYDRWRSGDADYAVVQFASTMNPKFPSAEFERARKALPDWKFRMMYLGEFSRPAGMIYEDFDTEYQVVDPLPLKHCAWYIGVDPGAVHTAVVWLAHDPQTDAVYVADEYLEGNCTTAEHVMAVKSRNTDRRILAWTGGAPSEKQFRMDWIDAGAPVNEPPIGDVEAGINRVIELIKTKRLFVFSSCKGVIDELSTYSREVDDDGQVTEKIKNKETYHRLDALRYGVLGMHSGPLILFGA